MGFMQEEENKVLDLENDEFSEPRVYEVGYLLVPTLAEEEIPAVYGNLKELIVSLGGQMISDEMPAMINLAYPMIKSISNTNNKFTNGYFGWVKFFLDPEKTLDLKKKLDLDNNFLRFLIIKTVKENTVSSKRFMQKEGFRRRSVKENKEENKEEIVPINKEEIDKEIDAMVAE